MPDNRSVTRLLTGHFFRRFFDNDTVQVDGDTTTTVVRAVSITAIPGLMYAFFLQNHYPGRPLWWAIEDHYFFVLFSFLVMGAVAVFEWEMLFPDRLDFLVLTPLPIKPLQMLAAKAGALLLFFTFFLVGSNLFGAILLPLVSHGHIAHQILAHSAAVLTAGAFAALAFLALAGLLLCLLGDTGFRTASPFIHVLAILSLVLLLLHGLLYGDLLPALLSNPHGAARWIPTFWSLGLYERLNAGASAAPFAPVLSRYGLYGTAAAAAITLITYPAAWARMRRLALEGAARRQTEPARWPSQLIARFVPRPGERAVFHFIRQTILRNSRYQVFLAIYCGVGLALALACAITFHTDAGAVHAALSPRGLHAVLPLLLFWTVAGLRTAFAFPLNLNASWIFRVTGVNLSDCAAAARRWALLCALALTALTLAALALVHWDIVPLLVQAVCGVALSLLLTDAFFASSTAVPFSRPRMPGRTSLPLMLTLYVGVLPQFLSGMVRLELLLERTPARLLGIALIALGVHSILARQHSARPAAEAEWDIPDEFQLLGLS